MRRWILAGLAGVACGLSFSSAAVTPAQPAARGTLNMESIMADPDWIGHAVESPHWSADGQALYYQLKRDGSPVRDTYRVGPANGKASKLSPGDMGTAQGAPVFDHAHQHAAFVLHGDVFLIDLASGRRVQVTRTPQNESSPRFSADGRALQFRQDLDWYSYDLASGVTETAAQLKFADDPHAKKPDALEQQQLDLFKTLRQIKADDAAEHAATQALDAADPSRAPTPFWLGDKLKAVDTELSPDGRWMIVVTQPKDANEGKSPLVIHYVTDSGYTKPQDARTYVGRKEPAAQSLMLLDLRAHKSYPLATDTLPGIKSDPLAAIRAKTIAALKKAGKTDAAKALKAPKERPVRLLGGNDGNGIVWSDDGSQAAIELRAVDNKDRWIASVDFSSHALVNQQRLTDNAWINWSFNDFGWLKDSRTLWFLSEKSGYSQLYTQPLGGAASSLTQGKFEVSAPQLSPDGRWFYVVSNRVAPYSYDVYRVPSGGGELQRVTQFQSIDGFDLSPDGTRLAVLHSGAYVLPQLAVVNAAGDAPRELTHTMKSGFTAHHWIAPRIVKVPSSHGAGVIYGKYYGPANETDAAASRPAVIFVHGAGYLQDVTLGWTYYFREQMFHNLLVQQGYVVLDVDYRASAGYGRDWRTAIYRDMGHPELEDLLDGKAWLVKNHGVDPKRVGIYGGSYGGFMTEMALLRAPGEFAAGAALRPPSDWVTYNDEYTANILNTPQLDPEAYRISSPINYADQLAGPLLMEHGLIDDNVMASDTLRLYQRFIELHKKNFWISLYPLERHGFEHPDSWFDEYRRIDELFGRFVKGRGAKEQ